MLDIQKIVTEKVGELEKDGTIQKLIEKKVADATTAAINELFNYDFSKKLTKTIADQVQIDLSNVKLPEYNQSICNIIQQIAEQEITQLGLQKAKEQIVHILTSSVPDVMKLSELVSEAKSWLICEDAKNMILRVSRGSSVEHYVHIDLNVKSKQSYNKDCLLKMMVDTNEGGHICSIFVDNFQINKTTVIGDLPRHMAYLMRLYAHGTKILIDMESGDIDVDDDNY